MITSCTDSRWRDLNKGRYYITENEHIRCTLCPNECRLYDGEFGICKVRKNIRGEMALPYYGRIAAMNLDPVEKKPLYHFHPGSPILSIGFFGCNMSCKFCQNHHISQVVGTNYVSHTPYEIIEAAKKVGFIAFTYSEPVVHFEFVQRIARLAKESGVKTVLVTNGYINPEPLREILHYIDAVNIDLKSFAESFYKYICKGKLQPVLDSIRLIHESSVHIEITNLLIGGANDEITIFENMVEWIKGIDKDIPLHISRYYPAYKMVLPETPIQTMNKAAEIARKHMRYVYIGNLLLEDNSTYCSCGEKVIERSGFRLISVRLDEEGKCIRCGEKHYITR